MTDLTKIIFDEKGLVPVIACDAVSNRVLMQAYANREALELTLKTNRAYYFSRSRGKLWQKGETSGNTQEVVAVIADCDFDSVLYRVIQTGPACHTGAPSCFFNELAELKEIPELGVLIDTQNAIRDRRENPQEGSYTNYLFSKGKEKICKKIAEESGEIIIAAMKGDNAELAQEAADLLYHLTVILEESGSNLSAVLSVLEARRNHERKREYK